MQSRLYNITLTLVLVSGLLSTVACGAPAISMDAPTVTALPGQIASPERPTSTLAPTPTLDIAQLDDYIEGMRQLEQGNFELAVAALRRVHRDAPDNEAAQTALAEAYLQWSQALVANSESDPEQLSAAIDKLVSGLSIAREGSAAHQDLQNALLPLQSFLQGKLDLAKLRELRPDKAELSVQEELANRVLELLGTAFAANPDLPGLRDDYSRALLIAAWIAEARGDAQTARADRLPYWEEGRRLSQRGLEVPPPDSEISNQLAAVEQRLDRSINPPPTARPQPTSPPSVGTGGSSGGSSGGAPPPPPPPPPPGQVIPGVRGADVGQARAYLQQLGFAVAVSPLPDGQDGDLCNGWVSYTSPPGGTTAPVGSQVILFYRSWDKPNPPGC